MHTLTVNTALRWHPPVGTCAAEWMRMFGLRTGHFKRRLYCRLHLRPGDICFLTGPGSSGKSTLLNALYEQIPPDKRLCPQDFRLNAERAVIDCIGGNEDDRAEAMSVLGKVGLGDDCSLLTAPAAMSSSRQWLYRLARMLISNTPWLFVDDFTALLDRISARVLAYQLRKRVSTTNQILIAASCHEDIMEDLQPDLIVSLSVNAAPIIRCKKDDTENG